MFLIYLSEGTTYDKKNASRLNKFCAMNVRTW